MINNLSGVEIEKYEEQVITERRGNLRLRLRFANNSLLEVSEAIAMVGFNPQRLSYRYHYQSSTGEVIFRYDDAPHHPEIKTYPHHKHIFGRVFDSYQPDIARALKEVKEHIMNQRTSPT